MNPKNNYVVLIILMLNTFSCRSQTNPSESKIDSKLIESKIDSLMEEPEQADFRGSILISKNDNTFFDKSYGDEITNSKTAFWIGSMSKAFTAAAILKLQEENKLSVSDSINKFLADVPIDKSGITIHHLLTHNSGLSNNYPADGIVNQVEATNLILSSSLEYAIGEKYYYSAEGYNLLAIIIEIISGEPYEDYVLKNILSPLKLDDTGFWGHQEEVDLKLASWNKPELMDSFTPTIINKGVSQSNYGFKGATGIFSTTKDLNRWVNALINKKLLTSKSLDLMFQPYVSARGDLENGVFYGYGWFLEYKNGALREIRHMGVEAGGIGHNGIIRFYDNGNKIIVLSNSGIYNGKGKLNGVERGIVLSFDLRDIVEGFK